MTAQLPHRFSTTSLHLVPSAPPPRRRLFLLDIENAVQSGLVTPASVTSVASALTSLVRFHPSEQVIIGASSSHAGLVAGLCFPGKLLRVSHGESGAERALVDSIDARHIASTFDEVVIVSGDHAFTQLAAELGGLGVPVTTIGHRGAIAASLRLASATTRFFPFRILEAA